MWKIGKTTGPSDVLLELVAASIKVVIEVMFGLFHGVLGGFLMSAECMQIVLGESCRGSGGERQVG